MHRKHHMAISASLFVTDNRSAFSEGSEMHAAERKQDVPASCTVTRLWQPRESNEDAIHAYDVSIKMLLFVPAGVILSRMSRRTCLTMAYDLPETVHPGAQVVEEMGKVCGRPGRQRKAGS